MSHETCTVDWDHTKPGVLGLESPARLEYEYEYNYTVTILAFIVPGTGSLQLQIRSQQR